MSDKQLILDTVKNIEAYGKDRVNFIKGDVLENLDESLPLFDFIVSNPPYILTSEMPSLQEEVKKEPATALDGGEDGLLFYRAILRDYAPMVKPGGLILLEIGYDQALQVEEILNRNGYENIQSYKDPGDHWRVVEATVN